ncbi:MAG: chorismate synthase [Legionellales bacterium]|nr:chorismate synthase [Legionellales bacterium]
MSSNTFGQLVTLTTFGESHGNCIGGVLDGCPAGLHLDEAHLAKKMSMRRPGQSSVTSPRSEADQVKIVSGVFEGITTGTPIAFIIENTNVRSKDYETLKALYRPGHADWVYEMKYGHRDWRGGGRSSARETAVRVAAGAIAEQVLNQLGVYLYGGCVQIGSVKAHDFNWDTVMDNPLYCPDPHAAKVMQELIEAIKAEGDSIGGKVRVGASGYPAGLGLPLYHKLEADIASAMMSINAVKAVEIGDGFEVVTQKGSEHRDEMLDEKSFLSNHAGGIVGGISTGQPIEVSIAVKPPSSIAVEGKTFTKDRKPTTVSVKGRHDPCVAIRAVPVAQAMLALVLLDHWCLSFHSQPLKKSTSN